MDARTHRRPSRTRDAVKLQLEVRLRGRLLRRYKRFFADIETPSGECLTVHCPNPGSMLGCAPAGAEVRCSFHDDPRRKLKHTLELVRIGRTWVGVHTTRANQLAALAFEHGCVPGFERCGEIQREVLVAGGSRLDFLIQPCARSATARPGRDRSARSLRRGRSARVLRVGQANVTRPAFVEVKSVTLAEGKRALFPDSVTERGRRHVETLEKLCAQGFRAALLFIVQRGDCEVVAPADAIDPAYAAALRRAAHAGVAVLALGVQVSPRALEITRALPVAL